MVGSNASVCRAIISYWFVGTAVGSDMISISALSRQRGSSKKTTLRWNASIRFSVQATVTFAGATAEVLGRMGHIGSTRFAEDTAFDDTSLALFMGLSFTVDRRTHHPSSKTN